MKKYYILIFVLVASLGLSSCQSKFDLRSNGTIDMTDVFKDRNSIKGYLNACYSYLSSVSPSINNGAYTDDAQHSQAITAGTSYDYWYNAGVTASNFASYNMDGDPWTNLWIGVRKCNVFLANIDDATGDMTQSERQCWKAQAYVLRGYYYLQLIKRYGNVPLILEDLGTTHDFSSDTKATISAIATQIISDCDAAIATPDGDDFSYFQTTLTWGMMTKAVAQAVRAETAMYAISPLLNDGFSKETALSVAADALQQLLSHDYSLWTSEGAGVNAYATYYLTNPNDGRSADKETIYGGSQVAVWSSCGIPTVAGTSTAGACPTQELVDAYEMANGQVAITGYSDAAHLQPIINTASGYDAAKPYLNRDPRFYATIWYNGSKRGSTTINTANGATCAINNTNIKYTHTGYYMRKYAHDNSNKNANFDGYIRTLRLTQVYYNFAEVAYQVSGPDTKVSGLNMSARDAVNAVRARVGQPEIPSGLSASDFETRYRNDRRVEFALEGDRYFSLRRWKTLSGTSRVSGMTSTGERFAFDERPTCTDKYLLYPISITEANKTQTLTGTSWQNAGWE